MLHLEAAGGRGGGTLPRLNSAGDGGWTYADALQDWYKRTAHLGSNTNFALDSAAASSRYIVTKEGRQDPVHSLICGSNTASTARRAFAPQVVEQQQQPVGKRARVVSSTRAKTRWRSHKKETCKCAVCMQYRGELKSSWYKHDQMNCACAVCRQARGASKHRGGLRGEGGTLCEKPSTPSMPPKRPSWLSFPDPSVECGACSRELPSCGGGQLQKQCTSFSSCNNVLCSSLACPPVRPESCTTAGIPVPWQQKLANLAKGHTDDCSSVRGIPPTCSSSLAPVPKQKCEDIHERFTCQQRLGCSCHRQPTETERVGSQTNLFSNSRCSGWRNADRAYSTNFTASNSGGVQHCTSDCVNTRRSWGCPPALSSNCSTGLSWQNTVNRCQDAAGTLTGLHNAEVLLLPTEKLVHFANPWESVKETSSAFPAVTERAGHWTTYPNLGNMTRPEANAAGVFPDPFLSLGQSTSFFGGSSSSMAQVQPDAASHSTTIPEMDFKPVYVPFQSSNSSRDLSGRFTSVVQFPFGLEVQAEAEHDIYQPVSDLQAPIHAQSTSFNFEEGTTESSSPPCETTSTTSVLNEKDNCSLAIDVDSGYILRSSCALQQGSLEKLMARTDIDAGVQARDQQLQSRCDKEGPPGKPVRQKFSKRLTNLDYSHSRVHQKRAKREGVSRAVPKWCQLIHPKNDHLIIMRKIYIRSRVPKRCPESPLSKVPEPSVRDEKNCNGVTLSFAAQGDNKEGRSRSMEFMTISNLQRTDPTGVSESTSWKGALDALIPVRREAFLVPEESIEELCESMPDEECSLKPLNSKKRFETTPETKAEDSPRDMKIRKLNCYGKTPERLGFQYSASVQQCNGNVLEESEATKVEMPSSLIESPDVRKNTLLIDLSNVATKIKTSDFCAIDYHLGNTVQLADPLSQNALAKVSDGSRGRKRLRTGGEICSEPRQTRLDNLALLISQSKDKYMMKPLKKRCTDQGAFGGTSAPYTDVEPVLNVDPARTTCFNSKALKLTIEVLLPESLKVYYFTKTLRARTTELTVWSTDLVRCMGYRSASSFMVQSRVLVPKEPTSLCPAPRVCPSPLSMPGRALKKYVCPKATGSVTWLKVLLSGTRIDRSSNIEGGKEISSDIMIVETRPRLDEEVLRRLWHVRCAEHGYLLFPHDKLTVYADDLFRHKPFDEMIAGVASNLSTLRKYCVNSLLCDIGPNVEMGGAKFKQQKMTAFEQHQQSLIQENLIPLRNILFPYWIDKPLNCSIRLACPRLKRIPLRLLSSSDAANIIITSREQDRTARSHRKQTSQYSTGENGEDDLNARREHREEVYSDDVVPKRYTSPPVNGIQTSVYNLMGHEQTPGFSAFHGERTTLQKRISLQTPSANSFQDLLKSVIKVDNNASSALPNNVESRTDPIEKRHQTSWSECSRSIPHLDVWERNSDLRNDVATSSALTSSCDSISKPPRRRGCPKGGWPRKKLSSPAANKNPMDCDKYSLRSGCRSVVAVDSASLTNVTKARVGATKTSGPQDLTPASLTNKSKRGGGVTKMAGPEDLTAPSRTDGAKPRGEVKHMAGPEHLSPASLTFLTKARAWATKLTRPQDLNLAALTNGTKARGGVTIMAGPEDLSLASLTNGTKARGGVTKMAGPEDLSPTSLTNGNKARGGVTKMAGPEHLSPSSLTNGTKARGGVTKMAEPEHLSPAFPVDRDSATSERIADGEADIEVIHPTNISSPKRQDSEFRMKLKTFLDRPFQLQELRDLEGQAFQRKPQLRLRETRHRVLHVATRKEGMSYLDHHPDLARKVADAATPEESLRLLRGFFFWIQHSCTSGSCKPWAPDVDEVDEIDDDCVEISKEIYVNHAHHMAPEAQPTVELKPNQMYVLERNRRHLTPRRHGLKRKAASQPTKSKYFTKQIEPSMPIPVKRERK